MGLSIYYKGKIGDVRLIDGLVDEVADICASLAWNQTIIRDENVDGIVFSPEKCEPCFFTFNKQGVLTNPIAIEYEIEPVDFVIAKTQFAGIDAHMAIIKLIRHLSEKYFSEFELTDEGMYWETNDEAVLRERFSTYEASLNFVAAILDNMEARPGETAASLADRIEALLRKASGDL